MRLAIFDIDGTLTETNDVDSVCFVRAMADAHAAGRVNTNWGEYAHTTDSFITREVLRERFGRTPDEGELSKFKSRFVSLLEESRAEDAALFGEVAGAAAALARLRGEPGWAVAIATGCWRGSGLMKLSAAGLEADGVPAAFAEDGESREEILLAALARAREFYGRGSFDRVVSLGDGLWDVSAARNLGFSFVGVGDGARASMLREAGASHVIEDFTDYERLLRCLSVAKVPAAPVENPQRKQES
jgi:phosphoglycolate phosphatase-like HAD superfamily hydrolase